MLETILQMPIPSVEVNDIDVLTPKAVEGLGTI